MKTTTPSYTVRFIEGTFWTEGNRVPELSNSDYRPFRAKRNSTFKTYFIGTFFDNYPGEDFLASLDEYEVVVDLDYKTVSLYSEGEEVAGVDIQLWIG